MFPKLNFKSKGLNSMNIKSKYSSDWLKTNNPLYYTRPSPGSLTLEGKVQRHGNWAQNITQLLLSSSLTSILPPIFMICPSILSSLAKMILRTRLPSSTHFSLSSGKNVDSHALTDKTTCKLLSHIISTHLLKGNILSI